MSFEKLLDVIPNRFDHLLKFTNKIFFMCKGSRVLYKCRQISLLIRHSQRWRVFLESTVMMSVEQSGRTNKEHRKSKEINNCINEKYNE